MTDAELLAYLNAITDPEFGKPLGELGLVKSASVADGTPTVEIELPTPAYPGQDRFQGLIDEAIKVASPDSPSASVTISWDVRGKESGGKIGLRVKTSSPSAAAKAESARVPQLPCWRTACSRSARKLA